MPRLLLVTVSIPLIINSISIIEKKSVRWFGVTIILLAKFKNVLEFLAANCVDFYLWSETAKNRDILQFSSVSNVKIRQWFDEV